MIKYAMHLLWKISHQQVVQSSQSFDISFLMVFKTLCRKHIFYSHSQNCFSESNLPYLVVVCHRLSHFMLSVDHGISSSILKQSTVCALIFTQVNALTTMTSVLIARPGLPMVQLRALIQKGSMSS